MKLSLGNHFIDGKIKLRIFNVTDQNFADLSSICLNTVELGYNEHSGTIKNVRYNRDLL